MCRKCRVLSPPCTSTVASLLTGWFAVTASGPVLRLIHLLRLKVALTRRYNEFIDMVNIVPLSRNSLSTRLSAAYLRMPRLLYTTAIPVSRLASCRAKNLTVVAMPRRPILVLSNPPDIVRTIILPNEHSWCELELRDGATDGLITRPCV